MVQKRLFLLALALGLLLGLTACGQAPQPQEPEPEPAADTEPVENSSLSRLQARLAEKNAACGIAFLGNLNGYDSLKDLITASPCSEVFPFLPDIPDGRIVTQEGSEVYCLVPRDPDAALTVREYLTDEAGEFSPGRILYAGDGQPVILVCNVSDVVPNLIAALTLPGGESLEIIPTLSLCDGTVVVPEGSGLYDFSSYPDAPKGGDDVDVRGIWSATAAVDGADVLCELDFRADGTMTYRVGDPNTEGTNVLEGTFYVLDSNSQYPAGSVIFELTPATDAAGSSLWGIYTLTVGKDTLTVAPVSGDPLLQGFESKELRFLPH